MDADLLGTSLFTYCKGVVSEVLAVGRCGTLVDWGGIATGHSGGERAYVVRYAAEDILNWQTVCERAEHAEAGLIDSGICDAK